MKNRAQNRRKEDTAIAFRRRLSVLCLGIALVFSALAANGPVINPIFLSLAALFWGGFLASWASLPVAVPRRIEIAEQESDDHVLDVLRNDTEDHGFFVANEDDIVVKISGGLEKLAPEIDFRDCTGQSYALLLERFLRLSANAQDALKVESLAADPIQSLAEWRNNPDRSLEIATPSGEWLIYDETKTSDGWTVGLFARVTQIKQREFAIRSQEKRLKDFAMAASQWFWETDSNHRFFSLSESFTEKLEIPAASVIGKKREDLVLDPEGPEFQEHLRQINAHEPFYDFRYPTLTLKSEVRHVSVSGVPFYSDDNEFLGYRGVARDVTEDAWRELRETLAQNRLADAVDGLRASLLLFDATDRLVIYNEQFKEIFGDAVDDVELGWDARSFLTHLASAGVVEDINLERDPKAANEWIESELEKWRQPVRTNTLYRYNNRWHERRTSPTREGGVLIVDVDVTDIINQNRDLIKAKAQADRASMAKTLFLAQMSHELRTPLNAIIGFSEVIRDELFGPLGTEKYKEFADDIHESGSHLLKIINDILDLSKSESGRREINKEPVSLYDAAIATQRLLRQRAKEVGVTIEVDMPDTLPHLLSEDQVIRQILINLVNNAVKFTESDGTVRISATQTENGGVAVSIADTGIGMNPEDVPQALEPFSQVDSKLTRKFEGTGLGLPLVQSLMRLHGGTTEIETEKDVGTTVIITFPPQVVGKASESQFPQSAVAQ